MARTARTPVPPRSSSIAAAFTCLLLVVFRDAITTAAASPNAPASTSGCIAAERDALLSFKAGITSDPKKRLSSWLGENCCQWSGVRCSNRTGHVIILNLSNTYLYYDDPHYYKFPNADFQLYGNISSSLVSLRQLKRLDLSGNILGKSMPEFLGSLQSLTHLNLAYMGFYGRVLHQLGNLSNLQFLDITSRFYDGYPPMHSADISWLARLPSLKYLDMSYVNLSSVVDWVRPVNMLSHLEVLRLTRCWIMSSQSTALTNLTILETLDLSQNTLFGTVTPNWVWSMKTLKMLNLASCHLSGSFPDGLGNLTLLEGLNLGGYSYLGSNSFEGTLPSTLNNTCNLRVLYLDNNLIGVGIKDLMDKLPRCTWNKLEELDLSYNDITGNLDWLGSQTSLISLYLSWNKFSGHLPFVIREMTNLTILVLDNNDISGVISKQHLSGLLSLEGIDMSFNPLKAVIEESWSPPAGLSVVYFASCQLGPEFPMWIKSLNNCYSIDVSSSGIKDELPNWFWNLVSDVTNVNISHNRIRGKLPDSFQGMLTKQLILASNQLTGRLPSLPEDLYYLDISRNLLAGPLPFNFGGANLDTLILFSNHINGSIPQSLCKMHNLRALDLADNFLVGELPHCLPTELKPSTGGSFIHSTSLNIHILLLSKNQLSGEFPMLLQSCQSITILDLAWNKYSGKLPEWIGEKLPSIVILRIRSNKFSGHIPGGFTKLDHLRYLDIANNSFSGTIPQSLPCLKGMINEPENLETWFLFGVALENGFGAFDVFGLFHYSISFVLQGQQLAYSKGLVYLVGLDFSSNKLSGHIPKEIGSLVELVNLNLSWNQLAGNIPDQIDDPSLMYIGNPGLCGYPLAKNCPENGTSQGQTVKSHHDGSFCAGLSVGFVIGVWMVLASLLFKKSWRFSYFHHFDRQYDRLNVFLTVTSAIYLQKATRFKDGRS
uniref:non-specific serine/threonine protein kinase n=1 Tax=Oryza meridionalis TaxID=40149 RepID=A0A0E0C4D8_9ORYZ